MPPDVAPGTQIGPYRLEARLGEGGMGVVYRAVDVRLNRPVAIKFLSTEFADAETRRRFQREAQTASSLNHPHILTVYDVGEYDGRQYLVTELVDGGTLRHWVQQERPSWRQIVDLLTGVADGLAAAHAAGILHRDIKPANILVAKNGYARLADFGLAKVADNTPGDVTQSLTEHGTRPGTVVGTIAYMSPEQATGRTLDARSDLFSFGIVLYELLAGRRPFDGASDLETLQKIIHGTPAPLDRRVPEALSTIVEKTLEHDPANRYQTARDLVVDLRRASRSNRPGPRLEPSPATRLVYWAAAACVVVFVALAAMWLPSRESAPVNPLAGARLTRLTDFEGSEVDAAISPDGRLATFVSDKDGAFDVWVSQIGTGSTVNLTHGRIDARTPLRSVGFSGDGSEVWLGGYELKRMQIIPTMGGSPRNFLGDKAVHVAWSPDGRRIVYHTWDPGDPMFIADPTGANAVTILAASPGEHRHFQAWSPDGRWIYFVRGRPATREMDLWRISSNGGTPERLTELNTDMAHPTPIGGETVLFVARDVDGSGPWLWALDVTRKTTRRVSFGLEQYTSLSASADGRRLAASVANPQASLWTVPVVDHIVDEAEVKPFPLPTVRALAPRFGGANLFYLSSHGAGDGVWRYSGGEATEIWKGGEDALFSPPAVSPDGQTLAIALRRQGKLRLHLLRADGSELRALPDDIDVRGTAAWSPDGTALVTEGSDGSGTGLFLIPIDGSAHRRLASGPSLDPVWSPDGAIIVYTGQQSATGMPLRAVRPNGDTVEWPPILVRREGERVRFSPDGKSLFYMQGPSAAQDFWVLDVASKKTRQLTRLKDSGAMRTFDITPDGHQIVFDRVRDRSDIVLIELEGR
ncbi:MAG TPA: protein kinase [Vicinamibacterales bacterium]|nr:protein kinase [Vicinamibacterales bacterium]